MAGLLKQLLKLLFMKEDREIYHKQGWGEVFCRFKFTICKNEDMDIELNLQHSIFCRFGNDVVNSAPFSTH